MFGECIVIRFGMCIVQVVLTHTLVNSLRCNVTVKIIKEAVCKNKIQVHKADLRASKV